LDDAVGEVGLPAEVMGEVGDLAFLGGVGCIFVIVEVNG
jgi:hypothetical protein